MTPSIAAIPRSAPRFFYGWVIALVSAFGLASSVAIFIPATIGLLVGPLSAEFQWATKEIFLAPTFATTATILIAPFMGAIIDRFGPSRVVAVSFLLEALIIASFYFLDGSLAMFYARYAAFAILATGTTHVAFTALVSRWFDRRRGLALGIALAGFGLGGVFWSLMAQALFDRFGWREAFPIMALFITLFTLPIMLLLVRDTPQSKGLNVDGDIAAPGTPDAGPKAALTGMTLREAARTRHYWLMALAFCLIGLCVQSIMLHMVPYLRARGESAQTAAAVQASLWAVLVVGRVSTGWLMDRFFAPRVGFIFLLLPIAGVALLASGASGTVALLSAMMVGLAAGAEVDVVAYLAGRYFGLKHYSLIYATYFSAFALGTGVGPVATAWAVEKFGRYEPAFGAISLLLAVAAAMLFTLPRFPKPVFPKPVIAPSDRIGTST
jgi:MFS family permease